MEDDALQPMLDEALAVSLLAGLDPQPGFQSRQRAQRPEPGLRGDECDSAEMGQPEPPAVDPTPPEPVSGNNGRESAYDEHDNGEVHEEHCVGKNLVRHCGGSLCAWQC